MRKGDKLKIQAGTKIESTYAPLRRIAKRSFTVTVHHVTSREDGSIEVNWAGSGGYWCWVVIKETA